MTPQIEFSNASFKIAGYDPTEPHGIQSLVSRVLHCFRPSVVSVAVYIGRKIQAPAAHIFPSTELDGIQSLISRVFHCFRLSVVLVAVYINRKIQVPAAHNFLEGYKC